MTPISRRNSLTARYEAWWKSRQSTPTRTWAHNFCCRRSNRRMMSANSAFENAQHDKAWAYAIGREYDIVAVDKQGVVHLTEVSFAETPRTVTREKVTNNGQTAR